MYFNGQCTLCFQLEGEGEESGEEGVEGTEKADTSKVYKPPKLAAMHYGKSSSNIVYRHEPYSCSESTAYRTVGRCCACMAILFRILAYVDRHNKLFPKFFLT